MPIIDNNDIEQMKKYTDFVRNASYTSVTQDPRWGKVKSNWKPLYVTLEDNDGNITAAMSILMIKNIDDGALAYCSKGPVCNPNDIETIDLLVKEAEPVLKENNVYLLRMDPEIEYSEQLNENLQKHGYLTRNRNVGLHDTIQPRVNMVINNLRERTYEDVFQHFRPRRRTLVRKSINNGQLKVDIGDSKSYMDRFYNLYEIMSNRHGITYRPQDYFNRIVDNFGGTNILRIYLAYTDECDLAGAVCFNYGKKLWYMYGGSTNKDSKLYAPYLIYNEMILDAFKQNCDVYDMGGVFALDASDGLWQIKHGFVQKETEYIGEIDKVYDNDKYQKFINR